MLDILALAHWSHIQSFAFSRQACTGIHWFQSWFKGTFTYIYRTPLGLSVKSMASSHLLNHYII